MLRDAKTSAVDPGAGGVGAPRWRDDPAFCRAHRLRDRHDRTRRNNPPKVGWNGFNVLHAAASRVGALDLGFVPGAKGRDLAGILDGASTRARSTSFICWVPTKSIWRRLGGAFVVYQGTHGDAGAHRADVVLPGAAYTEKSGLYVNSEGRVQLAGRATFPPGDAKEDWAILRALSDVARKQLPYDDLDAVRRAVIADAPHFATRDQAPAQPGADPAILDAIGCAWNNRRAASARVADRRLLSDQSDRTRERDHGRMLAALRPILEAGAE